MAWGGNQRVSSTRLPQNLPGLPVPYKGVFMITVKSMILISQQPDKCKTSCLEHLQVKNPFRNRIYLDQFKPFWFYNYSFFFSGTAKSSGRKGSGDDPNANLRPSTNSAFQKYIPAANIPTTADIMSKLSSSNSSSGSRRTSWERETGNNKVNRTSESNGGSGSNWSGSSGNKPGYGESHGRMASKVAKFCHVCGNSFPVVDIRFCCECGVKRLGL